MTARIAREPARQRRALALLAAVLLASVAPLEAFAAEPKKVFISADMEGVAGLVANSQFAHDGKDHELGRKLMTAEVNAAIEGAFEAGATEVVVADSHGEGMNLLPDQLDPRASLVTGEPRPLGMMQGIDREVAAAVFVGYHARASTAGAVMDHTLSGALKDVKLNGVSVGEYGLNAALAAHFGAPVVFVSGDDALADEARALTPGVVAVEVKQGIGMTAGQSLSPARARELIRQGVRRAVAAPRPPARPQAQVNIEAELTRASQADLAARIPGVRRSGPRTIAFSSANMLEAYKIIELVVILAATDHL